MKAFKTGCFIFCLMISAFVFSDEAPQPSPENMQLAKQIEYYEEIIPKYQNSPRVLFQFSHQLKRSSYQIKSCINKNQNALNTAMAEKNLIKDPIINNYLNNKKNKNVILSQHYQEELNLCRLLDYKITEMKKQIANFNQINYLNSYSLKRDNFFKSFQALDFSKIQHLPRGYVLETFLSQSNAYRYARWLMIILIVMLIFKMMQYYGWISKTYFQQLSIHRYLFIALIFIFISPVQYLILKTGYSHHDDILINLYKKPSNFLMTMAVLYCLYQFLDKKYFKYDLMMLVLTFFGEMGLISFCFALNYYDLINASEMQTLFCRYLILINLQVVLFYLFYWLFFRIYAISQPMISYCTILVIPILFVFLAGLYGYVDMAIHVDFSIIFLSINIVWLLISFRVKNIILFHIKEHNSPVKKHLKKVFGMDEPKVLTNFRVLIEFVFFALAFQVVAVSLVSVTWFYSKDRVFQFYDFFYNSQTIGNFSFIMIDYIYAIVTFLSLNIFNYAFANYFAHKIFDEPVARHKISQFFYIIGLFLIILISLAMTKINLQNLMLLFGGLSIGIGLGLKNILSNLISSLIIFTNRPFELGDFVSIGATKGFVKKVGILETMIETQDHDVVIMPNQLIASSPIENFTYGEKNLHSIHLQYRVASLTETQEIMIHDGITAIFQKSKFITIDEFNEPQFIFSPDTLNPGGYDLEIIFNINTLDHLKNIISELNRQIINYLTKKGIEIKFNNLSHPLT